LVDPILPVGQHRRVGNEGVDVHDELDLIERLFEAIHLGDGVGGVAPVDHSLDAHVLAEFLRIEQDRLVPPGHREALVFHHLLVLEPGLEILDAHPPDIRPVLPCPLVEAVVPREA